MTVHTFVIYIKVLDVRYLFIGISNLSRDEHLKDLETNIKRDLQAYHIVHFKQIKDQVILVWSFLYSL